MFTTRNILWGIGVIAVVALAWLAYSLYTTRSEEVVVQKAAQDVAKAENPFSADNPLSEVETDPLTKVKKVLNPF